MIFLFRPKHFDLAESQVLGFSRNHNIDKLTLHPIAGKGHGVSSWDRVDYSTSDPIEKTDICKYINATVSVIHVS